MNAPRQPNAPAPRPRRAEPLQPDRPGAGTEAEAPKSPAHAPSPTDTDRAKRQSDDALDNVREGYGRNG